MSENYKSRLLKLMQTERVFFYLLLCTAFFFLMEISYFIQCNKAYLDDFSFVSKEIKIPWAIMPGIFRFLAIEISIHLLYVIFIYLISLGLLFFYPPLQRNVFKLALSVWSLGIITLLIANQYYFPGSKFADLTFMFLSNVYLLSSVFFACAAIFILIVACAIIGFCLTVRFGLIGFSILAAGFALLVNWPQPLVKLNDTSQPNIIFIGIDSLRPDFILPYNHFAHNNFLNQFESQGVNFENAVTPLARTYPSWMSILHGRYPKSIGIRSNLAPPAIISSSILPAILKEHGYYTVFATDETRFSNIDQQYGFDQTITPPIGLNDFLLGTFNDFPLSNFLVNTAFGEWLFPYSYANRPAYFVYQPNTFLHLIANQLRWPTHKPLFFAVHFCLPHYPYAWADLSIYNMSNLERYAASIERANRQVADFHAMLQQRGLLKHAVVVLLSDHGEALELPGDRITTDYAYVPSKRYPQYPHFYPPYLDQEKVDESAGHGTDVLGLTQYHTLLTWHLFGFPNFKPQSISQTVSLIDITPTILDLLKIRVSLLDGMSLEPILLGKQKTLPTRHLFLESDYSPAAIRTVFPETRKVLLEGVHLFEINPTTTRLTVRPSMLQMIINSKQYADIYGDWMLALYPQSESHRIPVLINLSTGHWTCDLHSPFALSSPQKTMLLRLKSFYGAELADLDQIRG